MRLRKVRLAEEIEFPSEKVSNFPEENEFKELHMVQLEYQRCPIPSVSSNFEVGWAANGPV